MICLVRQKLVFESSVNSEGIETETVIVETFSGFESSVNSEGIETLIISVYLTHLFESSVNSEGIETYIILKATETCLRAV